LGDVIIFMPPLTIADEELKTLLDVTYDCIRVVTDDEGSRIEDGG
jgi:adenosylmethionine-8-amino-7-oxononanoate aminotransferase